MQKESSTTTGASIVSRIDFHRWEITNPNHQRTEPFEPSFNTPCSCGCDTRDGKHTGWVGYVMGSNGKFGITVWAKTKADVKAAERKCRKLLQEVQS